ncbi:MAG TPA: DUF1697 domain-containing protein [Thermoleophilaceae bacterium]|jgi:uncharacterized protein (DUF1697 family)|nr:DUF1697 domain-containing protein [Thermoleophilaceae bacterium]
MPRYAAFLRGINVGGTRIAKDDLCAPFGALGLEQVTTFRASGNVIFDGPRESATKLAKRIEERLAKDLGFTRAVTFIRTAAEMRALAEDNPIPREPGQKLHVMFCLKTPSASVLEHATPTDPLVIGKKELYWGPDGRMTDSQIDLKAIEKLIGPTTTRTKDTVDQIAARWFSA